MPTLPETSLRPALGCPHFPAKFQALIFRNWGIVPCARIARALGCSLAEARAAAEALGLDPATDAAPCWDCLLYTSGTPCACPAKYEAFCRKKIREGWPWRMSLKCRIS